MRSFIASALNSASADCRMIFERNLLGFGQSQSSWSLRECCSRHDQHRYRSKAHHASTLRSRRPYTSRKAQGTMKIVNTSETASPPMIACASGA